MSAPPPPPPSRPAGRPAHRPVLVREVLAALKLAPGMTVADGTVGAGGHAAQLADAVGPAGRVIGVDRDPMMLRFAAHALRDRPQATLRHASHSELRAVLDELSVDRVDAVLLDLGLSSDQLADRDRGFGIAAGGPLDLRFDTSAGLPAADLLATADEAELARVFTDYGEEPAAARIAAEIIRRRSRQPIRTAGELAELVAGVIPGGGKTHPATRVFQALRIAVNDELGHVERTLTEVLPAVLKPDGRAAALTFHSLEDRLAKRAFRDPAVWADAPKKPTVGAPSELRLNPRARSAKLRTATLRG